MCDDKTFSSYPLYILLHLAPDLELSVKSVLHVKPLIIFPLSLTEIRSLLLPATSHSLSLSPSFFFPSPYFSRGQKPENHFLLAGNAFCAGKLQVGSKDPMAALIEQCLLEVSSFLNHFTIY